MACSEASVTIQNRGFGIDEPAYEQAIHAFSGGFMHQGHACGILTGAVLAAGFAARARFGDDEISTGAALHAAIQLAKAFPEITSSVNCREMIEMPLIKLSDVLRYVQQGKGRKCGRIHLEWAPQVQKMIDASLGEFGDRQQSGSCANCAVQTLRELGPAVGMKMTDTALVAGFAGGVGLCGNVCGALAVGVFAMSAGHQLSRGQKKRDSRIRGLVEELTGSNYRGAATRLRRDFIRQFGSDLCVDIIEQRFRDVEDHSMFMEQDGCEKVTKFVADWVVEHAGEKGTDLFSGQAEK